MKLGYLQQKIIDIGREKGFVTSNDVKSFYSKNPDIEMNKLVALGYFEKPEDCLTFVRWKIKNEKMQT